MAVTRDVVIKVRIDAPSVAGTAGGTAAVRGGLAGTRATGAAGLGGAGMAGAGTAVGVAQGFGPGPRPGPVSRPGVVPMTASAVGTAAVGGLFRSTVPVEYHAPGVAGQDVVEETLTRAQRRVAGYRQAAGLGMTASGIPIARAAGGVGAVDALTGVATAAALATGPGIRYGSPGVGALAPSVVHSAVSPGMPTPAWQVAQTVRSRSGLGSVAYGTGAAVESRTYAGMGSAAALAAASGAGIAERVTSGLHSASSISGAGGGVAGRSFAGVGTAASLAAARGMSGLAGAGDAANEATGVFARMARSLSGANTAARQYNETLGKVMFEAARLATWSRFITRVTYGAEEPAVTAALGGVSARMLAGQAIRVAGPAGAAVAAMGFVGGQFGAPEGWGGRGLIASDNLKNPAGWRGFVDAIGPRITSNLWRPTMERDYIRQQNIETADRLREERVSAYTAGQSAAAAMAGPGRAALLQARLSSMEGTSLEERLSPYDKAFHRAGHQLLKLQAKLEEGPGGGRTRNVYELIQPQGAMEHIGRRWLEMSTQGFSAFNKSAWRFGIFGRFMDLSPGKGPEAGRQYSAEEMRQFPREWQWQMREQQLSGGAAWTPKQRQEITQQIGGFYQQRADITQQRLDEFQKFTRASLEEKRQELNIAREITNTRQKELQSLEAQKFRGVAQVYFGDKRQMRDIQDLNRRIDAGDWDAMTASRRDRRTLQIAMSSGLMRQDILQKALSSMAVATADAVDTMVPTNQQIAAARAAQGAGMEQEQGLMQELNDLAQKHAEGTLQMMKRFFSQLLGAQQQQNDAAEMARDKADAPVPP